MAEKKSQWQKDQERRRKDLLELKGESGETETVKKEEYSSPKTFKEKLENFWYHNKWMVMGAAAVVLVAAICIGQLVTKPKYDCQAVLYLGTFVDKPTREALEAQLEKHCPDVNGDGEVNVLIVDCCIYKNMQTHQMKDTLDRVQVQLMNPQSVLFIVDDDTIQQLDNTAPQLFISRELPDLSGRGVNLAGTDMDKEVQKADTAETFGGNYYIAARNFSESSSVHPKEEDMKAAREIIDNILSTEFK